MAFDISTYKNVLDHYLISGVKYLRYIRKSIGNTTIFYPIIDDVQIKSYVVDQIFKEGKTTCHNTSKPYSEWDWFASNYDICGLKELDKSTKADYFVLIVGPKAALVKLTSENFETNRLLGKTIFDIQSYFLLKASKRITRSGSYFYRYAYKHGCFEFGVKRLSFEQIVKIATDKDYTSDRIFIDYIQQVQLDEIDNLLQTLLGRHVRGCKGTDNAVSKHDWLNHTLSVFELMECTTTHQEDVRKAVQEFCQYQIAPTKDVAPSNVITAHYSTIKGTVNIGKLYDSLFAEGYIDRQTTKDDFMFYFSGIGSYPSKRIIWKGKKVLLAILIAKLHTSALTDWKTTEVIFEGVKGDNLKKQYNNSKSDSKSERIVEQLILQAK